jgi:uncharacterized protein YjiS (DUF1127 family)
MELRIDRGIAAAGGWRIDGMAGAVSAEAAAVRGRWLSYLRDREQRRLARTLRHLPDHLLRDIGLEPGRRVDFL